MDALWPSVCGGCGAHGAGRLCGACRRRDLTRLPIPVQGLRGCWVLAPYDSGVGAALKRTKARADVGLGHEVASLFAIRAGPTVVQAGFTAIVPAPSTPWSRFKRGFSLAAVLAEALADTTSVPVNHALVRRHGSRQVGLDRAGRLANLAHRVRCDVPLSGRVLLVDDVLTTGATADTCVRELLGAGASEVWMAVVCRANTAKPRHDALTLAAAAW
jgi:predicted amidophosphoribosyltransferase